MAKKKYKAPPIDRATPQIKKPTRTDVQKVQTTRTTTQGMQGSASWPTATDLQAIVKVWNGDADALETNAGAIAGLKDQLKTAESKQRVLRRNWRASIAQVLTTLNKVCNGSADTIKTFSVDVRTRSNPSAPSLVEGLTVETGTSTGQVVGRWLKGDARHGFVVQHATDPSNPATVSPTIPWTKTRFPLGGAPSGSSVWFRVAPVDPTSPSGTGPWTAWIAGTAR